MYYPSKEIIKSSRVKDYDCLYQESIQDRERFWEMEAGKLEWYKKWDKVMDAWWQTETGGFIITPLPIIQLKPGSAAKPFFGNEIAVVDDAGKAVKTGEEGNLVIKNPWPGMARTIMGDPDRFIENYWEKYEKQGWYLTGDSAKTDSDGYVWIIVFADSLPKTRSGKIMRRVLKARALGQDEGDLTTLEE